MTDTAFDKDAEGQYTGDHLDDSYPSPAVYDNAAIEAAQAAAPAITQTYSTTATTVAAATVAAVATTAATQTTPYGYGSAAQADAIPVAINALTADVLVLRKLINEIVDILQLAGLAT